MSCAIPGFIVEAMCHGLLRKKKILVDRVHDQFLAINEGSTRSSPSQSSGCFERRE